MVKMRKSFFLICKNYPNIVKHHSNYKENRKHGVSKLTTELKKRKYSHSHLFAYNEVYFTPNPSNKSLPIAPKNIKFQQSIGPWCQKIKYKPVSHIYLHMRRIRAQTD